MHSAAMARHGILVIREYQEVPVISMDKHKVLQILVNLIRNAKYAMDTSGRRDKRLTVSIRMNPENFVEVSVTDNGIGISQEALPRIFLPFAQGDSSIQPRFGGLGLGLSIAHTLVEAQDGTLEVESEGLGQGAKFTARFKVDDCTAAAV